MPKQKKLPDYICPGQIQFTVIGDVLTVAEWEQVKKMQKPTPYYGELHPLDAYGLSLLDDALWEYDQMGAAMLFMKNHVAHLLKQFPDAQIIHVDDGYYALNPKFKH